MKRKIRNNCLSLFVQKYLIFVNFPIPKRDNEYRNVEGIEICVSDEHLLKAPFPIEVIEEGIEICVSNEHSLKA